MTAPQPFQEVVISRSSALALPRTRGHADLRTADMRSRVPALSRPRGLALSRPRELAMLAFVLLLSAMPLQAQTSREQDFERLFTRALEQQKAGDILGAIDN